jgi:hypothetical protein
MSRPAARVRVVLCAALAAAVVLTGCGAGAGDTPEEVRLTVTDGFGREQVLERTAPRSAATTRSCASCSATPR